MPLENTSLILCDRIDYWYTAMPFVQVLESKIKRTTRSSKPSEDLGNDGSKCCSTSALCLKFHWLRPTARAGQSHEHEHGSGRAADHGLKWQTQCCDKQTACQSVQAKLSFRARLLIDTILSRSDLDQFKKWRSDSHVAALSLYSESRGRLGAPNYGHLSIGLADQTLLLHRW